MALNISMYIKEEFENKKDDNKSLVKKQIKLPPKNRAGLLFNYLFGTITKIPVRTLKCKQNLTLNDQDVLNCINDYSINIKESIKGGEIINMDTDFIKKKVLAKLHDEEYYKNDITNNLDNATKKQRPSKSFHALCQKPNNIRKGQ